MDLFYQLGLAASGLSAYILYHVPAQLVCGPAGVEMFSHQTCFVVLGEDTYVPDPFVVESL